VTKLNPLKGNDPGLFLRPYPKALTPVNPVSAKVSLVQRKDIPNMPFFGQPNERGIGQVHGMITIFLHQDSHPLVIVRALKGDFEITLMKHAPKHFLCAPTAGFSEKIHRLRESRPSRHHRSLQVGQTCHARFVIGLSLVNESHERPGIRENHLEFLPNKTRLKAVPLFLARPPFDLMRPMKGARF
jgi:hypothetical protein